MGLQWETETIKMNQIEILELKSMMNIMKKKLLYVLNSRLEMAGKSQWTWRWINRKYSILRTKTKKMKKSEQSLSDLSIINHQAVYIYEIASPRRIVEKEWSRKSIFEGMAENLTSMVKDINLQIQETRHILSKTNTKKTISRQTTVNFLKSKDKENIIKAARYLQQKQ